MVQGVKIQEYDARNGSRGRELLLHIISIVLSPYFHVLL